MTQARILVVDDEPAMLRSVERILATRYEIRTSSMPSKAIEIARDFRPHLAIVDIRMEPMDGFELMNALKNLDKEIDVILMTGSVYDVDEKLIRAISEEAFYYITKPFDREVLRTLVDRCMELRSMAEANRRYMAHMESQLAEARAFQDSMLPPADAALEGFKICAAHRPSAELAGDLYDYAAADRGRLALLIADVVGHGASAAMLTGIVKSAFHSSQESHYDPLAIVRGVRDGIAAFGADRFVTLLCARVSKQEGILEYVNAGHDGGLVAARGGGARSLEATGPLIAPQLPGLTWEKATAPWGPRSVLLLYTDGISDSLDQRNPSGVERVHSITELNTGKCEDIIPSILREIDDSMGDCPPADDMTLLAVWTPTKGAARPRGSGLAF
jgi:sigma-B regulation protein RsbU (phosphoserine phosphatase)